MLLLLEEGKGRAEEALTSLAVPKGAVIQIIYEENLVALPLQLAVAARKVEGSQLTVELCADVAGKDPFNLPIRDAVVVKAEYRGGLYYFKLRLGGYVNLTQYPRSPEELVRKSRDTLA